MKNHEKQPGIMKNRPETMKKNKKPTWNHENLPGDMKNHKNPPETMKNNENRPATEKKQPASMIKKMSRHKHRASTDLLDV